MSDDDLSELDSDKSDTHENEKSSLRIESSKIGWFPQLVEKKNPRAKYAVNRYRLPRPHFKDIVKLRYTRRQYQANKDRKILFRVCDGRRKSAYTRKQQIEYNLPFSLINPLMCLLKSTAPSNGRRSWVVFYEFHELN